MQYGDLTGKSFNFWTVLIKTETIKAGQKYYFSKCVCGVTREVAARALVSGRSKCCGCKGKERLVKRSLSNKHGFVHGYEKHPLRAIRKAMIDRCYNKKNPYFYTYGGKGKTVCKEWVDSLSAFIEWALKNGWRKGLSIDRIDNNGNYEPKNCQWITISENSRKNCILGKQVGKGRKKRDNTSLSICSEMVPTSNSSSS